jgi:hypothetical protein
MSEKVELKEKITAVDQNVRELWDALDADQQKHLKGEFYILNRYISNAKTSNKEIQQHFVLAVNEYYNKNWNAIQKHPKLLWFLLCMCSYNGDTTFFHEWIGHKKVGGVTSNKRAKLLEEIYPLKKYDELELLSKITTDKEVMELALDHGYDPADVKKRLK